MLLVMLLVYFKDAQTDKEFKKRQRHSGGIWEGKNRREQSEELNKRMKQVNLSVIIKWAA